MKLTYKTQTIICVILILLGNILADIQDHWLYRSVGFALCGLLFIIHPVVPQRIKTNNKSLFWARIGGVILILIDVFTRVNIK